jgi:fructose-1,6-bisphosphatase/inositol monophosphatase family enzyme
VLFAAPSVVHIAAGALLAAEAGALVVDVDARPWTTTATSLVAAADAATLEQVLKILDDGSDPSN